MTCLLSLDCLVEVDVLILDLFLVSLQDHENNDLVSHRVDFSDKQHVAHHRFEGYDTSALGLLRMPGTVWSESRPPGDGKKMTHIAICVVAATVQVVNGDEQSLVLGSACICLKTNVFCLFSGSLGESFLV